MLDPEVFYFNRNSAGHMTGYEEAGYELFRHGSNHDQYRNSKLRKTIPLKRHDFDENDLRYIIKEIKHNQEKES